MAKYLLATLFVFLPSAGFAAPQVGVTVQPVHSLVAAVMRGVGEPVLLLRGAVSPHAYNLRPSDMRAIGRLEVVFWVGETFETYLAKPLRNAGDVRGVALAQSEGIERLAAREGGIWRERSNGHSEHGRRHDSFDPHIWLDPRNAAAIAGTVREVLSAVDPQNAVRYQDNTQALLGRLQVLETEINTILQPVITVPYIVFHDAYQYFEHRFATHSVGAISIDPERRPGAGRIAQIRTQIKAGGIRCVFSEPQFEPSLIATLIEDSPAKHGVLDPLGVDLEPGPEAYFQLLRQLALSLRECLI